MHPNIEQITKEGSWRGNAHLIKKFGVWKLLANSSLRFVLSYPIVIKEGSWDAAKGVEIVRDVLSAQPVDGIYMHSDCVYSESTVQTLKELDQYAPRGEEGHIFIAAIDGCAAI